MEWIGKDQSGNKVEILDLHAHTSEMWAKGWEVPSTKTVLDLEESGVSFSIIDSRTTYEVVKVKIGDHVEVECVSLPHGRFPEVVGIMPERKRVRIKYIWDRVYYVAGRRKTYPETVVTSIMAKRVIRVIKEDHGSN